jgi:hypothetical protein
MELDQQNEEGMNSEEISPFEEVEPIDGLAPEQP